MWTQGMVAFVYLTIARAVWNSSRSACEACVDALTAIKSLVTQNNETIIEMLPFLLCERSQIKESCQEIIKALCVHLVSANANTDPLALCREADVCPPVSEATY